MRLLGLERLQRRYWRLQPGVQRRLKIAVPYFLMGLTVLAIALLYFDAPNWTIRALFTSLYVVLVPQRIF